MAVFHNLNRFGRFAGLWSPRESVAACAAAAILLLATAHGARAEMTRGVSTFASQSQCASSGKFPSDICAMADANAAAEFDEKAPRFTARADCERVYGACSIGFRGADGWAGRRGGLYFTPQRRGFRLTVRSESDATVTPIAPGLSFSQRSALRRDASINPRARREGVSAGVNGTAAFGVAVPEGAKGSLPPAPPIDPNFNCASVLEPGDKGDPNTGCVLAPAGRRSSAR